MEIQIASQFALVQLPVYGSIFNTTEYLTLHDSTYEESHPTCGFPHLPKKNAGDSCLTNKVYAATEEY